MCLADRGQLKSPTTICGAVDELFKQFVKFLRIFTSSRYREEMKKVSLFFVFLIVISNFHQGSSYYDLIFPSQMKGF